ncbi:MAG: copper chaperone PCu(A)C [Gallionellaceae bacterium]|nr:copper chaperone PCu(A)C [Gallionellaceae bacterium]
MINLYRLGGLLAALLLSVSVYAGDIQVDGAWARATPAGRNSANVYFFITSKQAATLAGASSPASQTVAMRTMTHKGGMMRTLDVQSIELSANARMDMTSEHGYHLALVELKAPLKAGETVPLTLNIQMPDKQSIKVDVRVEIKPPK